jgi:hypothetical protein
MALGNGIFTAVTLVTATANGGTVPQDHMGRMWDLTIPGNGDYGRVSLSIEAKK